MFVPRTEIGCTIEEFNEHLNFCKQYRTIILKEAPFKNGEQIKYKAYLDINTDKKMNAYVYGFKLDDAKKFLTKKLGKNLLDCQETIFRKMALEEDYGLDVPKGIILESEDKTFRCRLTLSEVIGQLLDKNRAELSEALFGGNS